MPKEIVVSHWPVLYDEEGRQVPMDEQGLAQVGWSAEAEHVQVVTLSRDPVSYETKYEGYYVSLDRRGINELIRHLRRARDQAFGRDE